MWQTQGKGKPTFWHSCRSAQRRPVLIKLECPGECSATGRDGETGKRGGSGARMAGAAAQGPRAALDVRRQRSGYGPRTTC